MNYVLDNMETILFWLVWFFIVAQFATMAALISIICNKKEIPIYYTWPISWEDIAFSVLALTLLCSYQWWLTAIGFASMSACWLLLKGAMATYHGEPKQQA